MHHRYRLRRSCLYVPGDKPRALDKGPELDCDMVILDLEDSVATSAKPAAREAIATRLAAGLFRKKETVLRVNGIGRADLDADLALAVAARPDGILVPKIESAQDLIAIEQRLAALGADPSLSVWLMLETPRAMLDIGVICAAAREQCTRVAGLVLGLNDLAKEMHLVIPRGRAAVLPFIMQALLATRAHGLALIDSVYNAFGDAAGFEQECLQARSLGFEGKSLIHPSQIAVANRSFQPNNEDIAEALRIVRAFSEVDESVGVIALDDRMVERLHLSQAEACLARARLAGSIA